MKGWRGLILRLLKVPPPPDAPPGSGSRTFRAAKNYFRYRLFLWVLRQLATVVGLVFALVIATRIQAEFEDGGLIANLITAGEVFAWLSFLAQIPFTLGIALLDYEMRWYIITDRSLRIREGIVHVREKTMTFANIQNISVVQGPLQRILGIADVEVRNAGGGGGQHEQAGKGIGEQVHVGYFRGVDNAEEIKEIVMTGVRRQRTAGLGDMDDDHPEEAEASPELALQSAAQELLGEIRALARQWPANG